MPYKERIQICEFCKGEYKTKDKRQRFCSCKCSGRSSNEKRKGTTISDEQKVKISTSLKKYFIENPDKVRRGKDQSEAVGRATKGKFRKEIPDNILSLSKRTVSKIIKRMELSCSVCGWNECVGDIHHIDGRKIEDHDNHKNLTYVCPNHHRMIHNNLINKEELITLDEQIGNGWKEYYFG